MSFVTNLVFVFSLKNAKFGSDVDSAFNKINFDQARYLNLASILKTCNGNRCGLDDPIASSLMACCNFAQG